MPTEPPIDVNLQNRSDETALTLAAEHGHAAIVARLLAMPGINANVVDSEGFTALMIASYKGHATTVEHLLTFPEIVEVNLQDEEGFTALMMAVQEGHIAIVARLLAVPGINVNLRNDFEKTALGIAQASDKRHKEATIKLLKDHGAVE
jgi:ankyrin repeat protein